ncbi:hypothetical protein GO013_10070 [Pseudodesulfovibrio sp. JC047]|uniref:hypothetical protein n=1 Tax=Pseudodesulfovibrio sp. JC047 TaxID=2683199 RepID=UPI0013D686C3|nr:hypothetical protein [Pseudodesulfovibrio sp. JC047]NDV19765.1 hypothetical protein [Pseudodesulfovibrio sp. JC047]
MDITVTPPTSPLPIDRAFCLSMVIKSFKGRRNVEVHLFRARWDDSANSQTDLDSLIGAPFDPAHTDHKGSRTVILESFTDTERDLIINYLKEQYSTRLTAIRSMPLTFPVPLGLTGLSQAQVSKNIGFIEFERIPSYSLEIPLKGLYDLSQHPPIVEG